MGNKYCWYCGNPVFPMKKQWKHPEFQGRAHRKTLDHIVPKCMGGLKINDGVPNVVVSCQDCNEEKDDLTLEEFRAVVAVREGTLTDVKRFWVFYGEI